MTGRLSLVEFPADDGERARAFWSGLLGEALAERSEGEGSGWQTAAGAAGSAGSGVTIGVHERGAGPGDRFSLPYFEVGDMDAALERVTELGGSVIHPGAGWSVCRDSEGTPFGLAAAGGR